MDKEKQLIFSRIIHTLKSQSN